MAKNLTDAAVKAAKPGATAKDMADGTVPGLSLRVLPSGRKTWALRLRVSGKPVRLDVGEYPGTSLADARTLALEARRLAGRGQNPQHAIRPPQEAPGLTVDEATTRWLAGKADNRSLGMERRRMALHVAPAIGDRPVRDVSRAEIAALLHNMAFGADPKPVEANRTYSSLRGLFRWCAETGLRDDDPTSLVRKPVKVEPSAKRQREGTVPLLSLDELARLWRAAPGMKSAVLGDLLRCLLLVPLRREEWTEAAWSELRDPFTADGWSGAALCIPAARMKGRRPAVVPLPPQVVGLLSERRKLTGRGTHVFAVAGRERPFAGWRTAAEGLRKVLPRQGDWSPHTIRKSVATALVRDLGADELLVGRILQHSPKGSLGVTAVYQRSDRLAEQAVLLTRWAQHLTTVAAGLEDKAASPPCVVSLPKKRA
jgi:integrase